MPAPKVTLEHGELSRLAQSTGVSLTHLHFVLRGERKPSRELAEQIAEHFHRPVSELFPELDAPVEPQEEATA